MEMEVPGSGAAMQITVLMLQVRLASPCLPILTFISGQVVEIV
jgi:hypothetical protein